MQRYTFHVISREAEAQSFFEGQDWDGPVTRRATRCSIYRDINLSPVPAGVMVSLACSFRNSAMSCETDFVSIAISLCASGAVCGVYQFMSLRKGMATIMTMKRHGK